MGRGNDAEFKKTVSKQYKELLNKCQLHMDEIEKELPPPGKIFRRR